MTYGELEEKFNEAVDGLYLTERQIAEIENRVKKVGVEELPELIEIIHLLRSVLSKVQIKFNEKQQKFLSGETEVE